LICIFIEKGKRKEKKKNKNVNEIFSHSIHRVLFRSILNTLSLIHGAKSTYINVYEFFVEKITFIITSIN